MGNPSRSRSGCPFFLRDATLLSVFLLFALDLFFVGEARKMVTDAGVEPIFGQGAPHLVM